MTTESGVILLIKGPSTQAIAVEQKDKKRGKKIDTLILLFMDNFIPYWQPRINPT